MYTRVRGLNPLGTDLGTLKFIGGIIMKITKDNIPKNLHSILEVIGIE